MNVQKNPWKMANNKRNDNSHENYGITVFFPPSNLIECHRGVIESEIFSNKNENGGITQSNHKLSHTKFIF